MSRKQTLSTYGVVAAVFAAAIAGHDAIVIPIIRQAVAEDRNDAIETHGERPHADAVHKDQHNELRDWLSSHEKEAKQDRNRSEDKLDRVEDKVDRVTEILIEMRNGE